MDDFISTEEAGRLLRVGPTAVKRWADQGLLPCVRTPGGHRRYSRTAVERFLRADARSAADGLADLLVNAADGHVVQARLLAERSRLGAWHRVATALGEALEEMGRRWETGKLSIAQEHLASERLARALTAVSSQLPLAPGAPCCLLATAEGDDHTLGMALAELCLREAGWTTAVAGQRTPTAEIASAARLVGARMVALSASCASADALPLRRQAAAVAAACRAGGAQLVLGGGGPWPEDLEGAVRFRSLEAFAAWARGTARAEAPGTG